MDERSVSDQLAQLALRCPHGSTEHSCPLACVRNLPLPDQIRFIRRLTDNQRRAVLKAHCRCQIDHLVIELPESVAALW